MRPFTIRAMVEADCEPLAAWMVNMPLWQRYGLTAVRAVSQFREALTRDDLLLTVVNEKGITIGFAWVMPRGAFGRSPYLRLIGVHPDYAGAGIGAALLEAVEILVWESADALFLLVSDFNQDAQRFYERQGYTRIGTIPDYVAVGITEYMFWKRRESSR